MHFDDFCIFGKLATRAGIRFDAEIGAFFECDNHCEDIKKKNSAVYCPIVGCSWKAFDRSDHAGGGKKTKRRGEKPPTDIEILKEHMFSFHKAKFCDLCLDHKQCLLHNQPIFTSRAQYEMHLTGDIPEEKAIGFQGHSLKKNF